MSTTCWEIIGHFFQTSTKETNKKIVEAMIRQNDPTRELSNVHVLCIYVNLAKLLPDLPWRTI